MKESPLISVIIPCYKVEQYLPKCVDSILSQSYTNLEILLVDDGSPDRCGDICEEYARKDSRIKVIHKLNGGLSDARNVAIDVALGEWVTFVDSDDYVADNYIETLYQMVKENKCKISVADILMFKEGETIKTRMKPYSIRRMKPIDAVEMMFYQENFDNCAYAKLYHRSLFETGIRYPKGLIFEDLATTYLLMLKSDSVVYMNKPIYYYLLRGSGLEGAYSPKKTKDAFKVISSLEERLSGIDELQRSFSCRKMSFFFHIYLALPDSEELKGDVKRKIIENRNVVLFDNKARKKTRIAALCSYISMDFVKLLFRFINKR